jgi:hypothetical protein
MSLGKLLGDLLKSQSFAAQQLALHSKTNVDTFDSLQNVVY